MDTPVSDTSRGEDSEASPSLRQLTGHSASIASAAVVDGAAAAVENTYGAFTAMRDGAARAVNTHVSAAIAVANSRNLPEAIAGMCAWGTAIFDETIRSYRDLGDRLTDSTRNSLEPIESAFAARSRAAVGNLCDERDRPSWQAQMMNLCLRVTVKRLAARSRVDDVPNPQPLLDRLLPSISRKILVETVELESCRLELFTPRSGRFDRTVLHCPGGGFVMAATQAHRLFAAQLVERLGARVVLVHYRLAPEHRFPAGLDDCCAAYEWLLANGASAESIILSGDSAGGGLALSTLLRSRDAGIALPAGTFLVSPVTDLTYSGQSRIDNRWLDPTLPNDDSNIIAELYLGDTEANHPHASPLYGNLSGLPPMLIQVGSIEVLLDDSLRVAEMIDAQGGVCECEVWPGMPHDFVLFGMLPEASRAVERIAAFVDTASPPAALAA